jgi:recombination protein RecR
MSEYQIQDLIDFISRLPTVGSRSAKKIGIAMLKDRKNSMIKFANLLTNLAEKVKECEICRNIDTSEICSICQSRKNVDQICVVANIEDLWNVEKSGAYNGLYFTLWGLLSATTSTLPKNLGIDKLCNMIAAKKPKEIIFALGSTMASQTTYYFVLEELEKFALSIGLEVKFTSLAFGIPMGSEIDYLDEGTLIQSFKTRA